MKNEISYFNEDAQNMRAYESTLFFGELLGEDLSSTAMEGLAEIKEKLASFNIKDKVIELGKTIAAFFKRLKDMIVNFFKKLAKTNEYEIKIPDMMKVTMLRVIKGYNDETLKFINSIHKIEDVADNDAAYIDACAKIDDDAEGALAASNEKKHQFAKASDYTLTVENCQAVVEGGIVSMEKLATYASNHMLKVFNSNHVDNEQLQKSWATSTGCINRITAQSSSMVRMCTQLINGSAKKIKVPAHK